MHRVFQIRSGLRAVAVPPARVFMLGEREQYLLEGALFVALCPLLDGRRTVAEILAALGAAASTAEILYALTWLETRNYIERPEPRLHAETAAFWRACGQAPRALADTLMTTSIAVHGSRLSTRQALLDACAATGLKVTDDAAIHVHVVDDYLDPALDAVARAHAASTQQWLPLKAVGDTAWLGPVFGANARACWTCLQTRLRHNRPVSRYVQQRIEHAQSLDTPLAINPAAVAAATNIAALALLRWLSAPQNDDLDGSLLSLDFKQFSIERHAVTRRPQCPACGVAAPLNLDALRTLQPRTRIEADDGGLRCARPELTYARLQHLVSPITGIISSLGPLDHRAHPLRPVYAATYRLCPSTDTASFDDFHQASLGKGRTTQQARTSALCEALERWSAVYQGDEARHTACAHALGADAIGFEHLLLFSARQYAMRDQWNAAIADQRRHVPRPPDANERIDWSPAWSLTDACVRQVPTAYCYQHVPAASGSAYCHFNPNGHAAGGCLEEAILQGFFELVERDAVALWWYNQARRPGVNLGSFHDTYIDDLRTHYDDIGYALWVLDLTSDLGIPSFAALAQQRAGPRFHIGFGCHLDARIGIHRALTEVNQLMSATPNRALPWDRPLRDEALLHPGTNPARVRSDFAARDQGDLLADITYCVAAARARGLETLVVDQTRPEIGLNVVKVIVPGLRHFWPRFAPGRLYDTPVELGWVAHPCAEERLNEAHLFL